jgi:hypothetical protein
MALTRTIMLALALTLPVAASAHAATTVKRTTSGKINTLSIVGDSGEDHDISVEFDDEINRYVVTDDETTLITRQGCSYDADTGDALCSIGSGKSTVVKVQTGSGEDTIELDLSGGESSLVSTGDGDDLVTGLDGSDLIDAGAGDDTVEGSSGNDTLYGGAGTDDIEGGPGDDWLFGGPGDDVLSGDQGADVLAGAEGTDTADYASSRRGVRVDLDGNADDGAPNENDNVKPDVENIRGSSFDDVLIGGPGPNVLNGLDGNDYLGARDGYRDTLICGAGYDSVQVDGLDVIEARCEQIDAEPGPPSAAGFKLRASVCATRGRGRPKKAPKAMCVRVECPGALGGCKGQLTLSSAAPIGFSRRKPRRLAGKAAKLGAARFGAPGAVRVKLGSLARRFLRLGGRLDVRATIDASDADGRRESHIESLRILGPRKKKRR